MTNQSVVVSDAKSGFGVRFPLSPDTIPSPVGGRYLNISKKKLMKRLETEQMSMKIKITSWVDSMRASSPPRVRPTSWNEEKESWLNEHPSALSSFDEIVSASRGKQIVVFLDYDGTLSPIVEDPDRAFMSNEMREAVNDTAKHFPTAIVTGRCMDKVREFVRLAGLYYAGSHGMDIEGPTKTGKYNTGNQAVLFQPAREFLPMIQEVYNTLIEKTKAIPGSIVENNKFCVSVHYRCVDEKKWASLADEVRSVLSDYPKLRLSQGRKVLEIRPTIKWDKGKALEFLLESLGFANSRNVFPIYVGDDRTDEDAFKVLKDRRQGLGILVSKFPKATNATYSLREPSEVKDFLQQLVQWKREAYN